MTGQLVVVRRRPPRCSRRHAGRRSRRDFISKCSIGLKEARESHVRLRVCYRCSLGPRDQAKRLIDEAPQIAAIIGAIVRNTRRNAGIAMATDSRSKVSARSL